MYVYQIRSLSDPTQYYTGVTADLDQRLAEHNAGKSPHTSKHAPWTLVASVLIPDKDKAHAFEKYLPRKTLTLPLKKHLDAYITASGQFREEEFKAEFPAGSFRPPLTKVCTTPMLC